MIKPRLAELAPSLLFTAWRHLQTLSSTRNSTFLLPTFIFQQALQRFRVRLLREVQRKPRSAQRSARNGAANAVRLATPAFAFAPLFVNPVSQNGEFRQSSSFSSVPELPGLWSRISGLGEFLAIVSRDGSDEGQLAETSLLEGSSIRDSRRQSRQSKVCAVGLPTLSRTAPTREWSFGVGCTRSGARPFGTAVGKRPRVRLVDGLGENMPSKRFVSQVQEELSFKQKQFPADTERLLKSLLSASPSPTSPSWQSSSALAASTPSCHRKLAFSSVQESRASLDILDIPKRGSEAAETDEQERTRVPRESGVEEEVLGGELTSRDIIMKDLTAVCLSHGLGWPKASLDVVARELLRVFERNGWCPKSERLERMERTTAVESCAKVGADSPGREPYESREAQRMVNGQKLASLLGSETELPDMSLCSERKEDVCDASNTAEVDFGKAVDSWVEDRFCSVPVRDISSNVEARDGGGAGVLEKWETLAFEDAQSFVKSQGNVELQKATQKMRPFTDKEALERLKVLQRTLQAKLVTTVRPSLAPECSALRNSFQKRPARLEALRGRRVESLPAG